MMFTEFDLRKMSESDLLERHDRSHEASANFAPAQLIHAVYRHEIHRRGLECSCPEVYQGDTFLKMESRTESPDDGWRTITVNGEEVKVGPGETLTLAESGGLSVIPNPSEIVEQGFAKAIDEQRYTLSAWYIPGQMDAHGEWTDPAELQQAAWRYVRRGDRQIRLQHNTEIVAGEWVEILSWPFEVVAPRWNPDTGEQESVTYPAGTVFLGVIWDDWAWALVKEGQIRGLSIGGTAWRVEVDMPETGAPVESE